MNSPASTLIDSHCHLFMEPLSRDIPGVLSRAEEKRVSGIVVPAVDEDSWAAVALLSETPGVFAALGVHPWFITDDPGLDRLENRLKESHSVAIGEIGLDYKIDSPGRAIQMKVFRRQLDLALEMDLPVILHCRGAYDDMLDLLSEDRYKNSLRGVIHAYSRGPQLAERFLELGFYIAFGGVLTRPRAIRAARTAGKVPINRILLETDAPSIGMDGLEPENVEPAHVYRVAEALAELRGVPLATVAERTAENTEKLFGISRD